MDTTKKKRILIVDDESDLCEILKFNLSSAGYQADAAGSASEALDKDLAQYDLLLLDVMMPGMSGFDLAQHIKGDEATANIPIIFLTALGTEDNKLHGFELGADDYISKPFSPKILAARVNAILRRSNLIDSDETIEAAGIILDKAAHQVIVDGKKIELSFKEFELLTYFMENQNIALSREKILNNVWNYDYFGDARTIDTHVKKLRSKIGEKGDCIKTIWGMGYKFEA